MNELYVMRRANGDLLAVEIQGKLRIPVWSSEEAVARYRALNPELVCFWPVTLNESVADRVTRGLGSEGTTEFFLLSETAPQADLEDGRPVSCQELFPGSSQSSQSASAHS